MESSQNLNGLENCLLISSKNQRRKKIGRTTNTQWLRYSKRKSKVGDTQSCPPDKIKDKIAIDYRC